jgi:protein FAM50
VRCAHSPFVVVLVVVVAILSLVQILEVTMGDFSKEFSRPDAGAHTVEGNVSGSRAAMLEKKRQAEQESFELEKQKRQRMTSQSTMNIGSKFQPASLGTVEELSFKAKTVGLVSAKDFKEAAKEEEKEALSSAQEEKLNSKRRKDESKKKNKKKMDKKKIASRLSFMNDDDDEAEAEEAKETKSMKDPTVDTSFLPDKRREEEEQAKRIALEQQWKERQIAVRDEKLEIVYSYWDGSGHRRNVVVTKGASIGEFLEDVRKDLCKDFKELGNVASDALVYVKEDLILPHDITFYDLIATKARGKSGPLFHFDVHEDVRVGPLDRRIEKDESHPGKVVERRWFERNKHIFPASRWEIYDPVKTYGDYTIAGGIVNKKGK